MKSYMILSLLLTIPLSVVVGIMFAYCSSELTAVYSQGVWQSAFAKSTSAVGGFVLPLAFWLSIWVNRSAAFVLVGMGVALLATGFIFGIHKRK